MSEDVVTRAEALLSAATRGPWKWDGYRVPSLEGRRGDPDIYEYDYTVLEAEHSGECGCRSSCELQLRVNDGDAALIAEAPTVIAELVARSSSQAAEIEQLREKLIDAHLEIIEEKTDYWHDVPLRPSAEEQVTDGELGPTLDEHLGMTDAEAAHYVCDPREFVRQKLFGGES